MDGRAAVLLAATLCLVAGQAKEDVPASKFESVPARVLQAGEGNLEVLKERSSEEGFLDRLFNTDCYSDALASLGTDCKGLGHDQKNRLAVALANCQLSRLGAPTYRCSDSMSLKDCVEGMDDKAYHTFSEFFAHIDSMCLFLQNQNFQQATENTMNKLYSSSSAAAAHLDAINSSLGHHKQQLAEVEGRVLDLGVLQEDVLTTVTANLETARALESKADVLDQKLQQTLDHGEALLQKQTAVMNNLAELSDQEQQRAVEAVQHWKVAADSADVAFQHFEQFKDLQQELAGNYREIVDHSQDLRSALDLVLEYEQRSDAVLVRLLGQSWSISDLLFYAASGLAVIMATSLQTTQRARIPLFLLLVASFVAERVLLDKLHDWLGLGPFGQVMINVPMPRWLPPVSGLPTDEQHFLPLDLKKMVRWSAVAIALSYLARVIWGYRNYEELSYRAVLSIEAKMRESEERFRQLLERQRRASIADMGALLARHGMLPADKASEGQLALGTLEHMKQPARHLHGLKGGDEEEGAMGTRLLYNNVKASAVQDHDMLVAQQNADMGPAASRSGPAAPVHPASSNMDGGHSLRALHRHQQKQQQHRTDHRAGDEQPNVEPAAEPHHASAETGADTGSQKETASTGKRRIGGGDTAKSAAKRRQLAAFQPEGDEGSERPATGKPQATAGKRSGPDAASDKPVKRQHVS